MNGPTLGALALTAVAGTATAGSTDSPNEYLSLDRELDSLARNLAAPGTGVTISAWIKTDVVYQDQSKDKNDVIQNADGTGVELNGVRLNVAADVTESIKFKVSADGASQAFLLRDAWAQVKLCEEANLTFGQYRVPVLQSSSAADEKLAFFTRSRQGDVWKDREPGAMFDGKVEQFRWYVSAQNGGDGIGNDMLLGTHVAFDAMGPGITKQEAGYGPNAETALTLGLSYMDEGTLDKGSAMAFEVLAVTGPIFVQAEIADYDDDFAAGAVTAGAAKNASGLGDTTPYGITATYALNAEWEAAIRYQDADDVDDTTSIGLGLNYYMKNHDAKWQLNFISDSSDNADKETDKVLLGLVLAV